MRNVFVTLVGLTIATSVVAAQAPDAAKVAAGQKIYEAQKCNTCHMIQGKGIKKWLTDSAAMEKNLKEKPKMPMSTFMKSHKLSDADVDALTAYMMSLK
jgi:mono/diheme cytochrome c family protein